MLKSIYICMYIYGYPPTLPFPYQYTHSLLGRKYICIRIYALRDQVRPESCGACAPSLRTLSYSTQGAPRRSRWQKPTPPSTFFLTSVSLTAYNENNRYRISDSLTTYTTPTAIVGVVTAIGNTYALSYMIPVINEKIYNILSF